MKTKAKKTLSFLLACLLFLTAGPLTGMTGETLAPKAAAATYKVGDIITFGGYPQSQVTDSAILSALNALEKNWVSYRYYSGTGSQTDGQMQAGDWMRYADLAYNGAKYRAVTFDSYRPYWTGSTASADNTYQDENGFVPGNVYYFKYDSLKWRVLDPTEGLVLCENIIDSQAYQDVVYYDSSTDEYYQGTDSTTYASDYATSSIRTWLMDDFYNVAFSTDEKALIGETTLDNSAYSSSYEKYNSVSTTDKLFLLSYTETLNAAYGFSSSFNIYDTARRAQGTDYAKCQGLCVYSSDDYPGNSFWRLRSPGSFSRNAAYITGGGWVYAGDDVDFTVRGVRPAFRFKSGISESLNPNGGDNTYVTGDIIKFGGYPQSRVTDSATLSALDGLEKNWVNYGYYSGTDTWDDGQMQSGDWMRYADLMYNGNKYRAVVFDSYRPYRSSSTASAENSYQDENGYAPGTVYYFKYESLLWQVLDPSSGLVLCKSIIDAQAYQNVIRKNADDDEYYQGRNGTIYANDYATSSIRAFLTADFYNTAFSVDEKALIGETTLDNSAYDPRYDSASTTDKIFLLSYADTLNTAYGFSASADNPDTARCVTGTDYAKCQGLCVSGTENYVGNSWWRLRSAGASSCYDIFVCYNGFISDTHEVSRTGSGVRPAFRFASPISPSVNPNGGETAAPEALTAENVTLYSATVEYNGKVRTPVVTVKNAAGMKLTEGTDYTVTLPAGRTVPGTYTYTVTGKGGYTGAVSKDFVIRPCTLKASDVTLYAATVEYNGKVRTPKVTVKSPWGVTLTEGTHYTVTVPEGRTVPGTYVYKITGKGRFTGTVNANFVIKSYALQASDVTLYSATVEYNGKVRTPKVTVKSSWGATLTEGTHYTVTVPEGRTIPGTYVYKITGKGRFTGTVNANFVIKPCTLTADNVSLYSATVEYNSKQRTPKVTVKSPWGVTLTEGTHYTVTVPEGRTVPGTYVYKITGKGRFAGTVDANFVIKRCTLTADNVSLYSSSVTYNGKIRTPKVTVKSPWGVTLTEGTHYTVAVPAERTNAGTYVYKITGKGRFTGAVNADFVINPQPLKAENVTLYSAEVTYNGKQRTPSVTVKNAAGETLAKGTDYTVTVPAGRTDPGTYVYMITGKGNYTGTLSKDFVIKPTVAENPTATLIATNKIDSSQTVTLSMQDDDLLSGYFWGMNADYAKNTFYDLQDLMTGNFRRNLTVSAPGTYYFTVVNRKGLTSDTLSVTYYRTTLDPNGGTVSPTVTLNKANVPITLPTPVKSGGVFERWSGDGEFTCNYTPTKNRSLIASYRAVDNIPPVVTLSSTNYLGDEQALTISFEDDTKLACYYWGKDPDHTKNERVALGGKTDDVQITISEEGTYYVTLEDAAGNVSEAQMTYYLTTLNPNGGFVTPKKILTPAGFTFVLPTPQYTNHTFKSWGAKEEDLTEDGYCPSTSATLTAVWG